MPLSEITAESKEELISKIIAHEIKKGKSEEQAAAIAYAEAKKRGYKDIEPLSAFVEYSAKLDKAQELNGVLKVPVTLVAEMVQRYSIEEVPWLREYTDQDVITVLKDGDEIRGMVDEWNNRGENLLVPFVVPHTDAIYCEKQCPLDIKDKMGTFIPREQMKGYVRDLRYDEATRSAKGNLYMNIAKNDPQLIQDTKEGKITDVSIGFTCNWTDGGMFKDEEYMLKQTKLRLGHLAGLPGMKGKCSSDKCGINKDQQIEPSLVHVHNKGNIFMGIVTDQIAQKCLCALENPISHDASIESSTSVYHGGFIKSDREPILNTEVKSSMPTIEELQAQLIAKDAELAAFKDAKLEAKNKQLEQTIHDKDVEISAKIQAIAAKDAEIEALTTKLATAEKDAVERYELVTKLTAANITKIGDQSIKDATTHDIKIFIAALDAALAQNGLTKGTQEAHDAQLNQSSEPKKLGVVGATADKINSAKKE